MRSRQKERMEGAGQEGEETAEELLLGAPLPSQEVWRVAERGNGKRGELAAE